MSVHATFEAPKKPEGTVTVTLTESDARDFVGHRPLFHNPRAGVSGEKYCRVRDEIHYAIRVALGTHT